LTYTNGHDFLGILDELVPGEAVVNDDIAMGFEDAVVALNCQTFSTGFS
jgi:hypothetical protein